MEPAPELASNLHPPRSPGMHSHIALLRSRTQPHPSPMQRGRRGAPALWGNPAAPRARARPARVLSVLLCTRGIARTWRPYMNVDFGARAKCPPLGSSLDPSPHCACGVLRGSGAASAAASAAHSVIDPALPSSAATSAASARRRRKSSKWNIRGGGAGGAAGVRRGRQTRDSEVWSSTPSSSGFDWI